MTENNTTEDIKILFSSFLMFKFLRELLQTDYSEKFICESAKDSVGINYRVPIFSVETKGWFSFTSERQQIINLCEFLKTLPEQPVTLGVKNDRFVVKDACF